MADDERPEGLRDWLTVEPLDDVTRRRLVSTALREAGAVDAPAPARLSRAWRWLAAAAVIVVLLVGGLALLTAQGGHDEPQASRTRPAAGSPPSLKLAPDVGDFGDLDQPANLARLRRALDRPPHAAAPSAQATTPTATGDSAGELGASERALDFCGDTFPSATVLALGSGTFDGRAATVFLVQNDDGTRSLHAVLEDPCENRTLDSG